MRVSTADEFSRAVWRLCAGCCDAARLRGCEAELHETQLRSAEILQKTEKSDGKTACLLLL